MLEGFRPAFSGTFSPERLRPDFIAALAKRVRSGLFPLASPRRNQYVIVEEAMARLRFRSKGLLSSITIGWNDVQVQIDLTPASPGTPPAIHYGVTFWDWTRYSVLLCGAIAASLIVGFSLLGSKARPIPGSAKIIFWVMVGFWGFIWPWILVVIHQRPAARML
jgi:hypothetical protein